MKKDRLAAVRGMNDLLPAEAPLWEWFEARVVDWLRSYGYQQIRTERSIAEALHEPTPTCMAADTHDAGRQEIG